MKYEVSVKEKVDEERKRYTRECVWRTHAARTMRWLLVLSRKRLYCLLHVLVCCCILCVFVLPYCCT